LAAAAVVTCSDEQVAPQCTPLILHGRRTRRRQSISRENETSAVSRACPARLGRNGDRAHRSTVSLTGRRQRDEASDCWVAHAQVGASPPPHAPARQTVTPVRSGLGSGRIGLRPSVRRAPVHRALSSCDTGPESCNWRCLATYKEVVMISRQRHPPLPPGRRLPVVGPLVMVSVIATGNHYVFDVAAALVVVMAGYAAGRAMSGPVGQPAATQRSVSHLLPATRNRTP
jgi:hypothetical protein